MHKYTRWWAASIQLWFYFYPCLLGGWWWCVCVWGGGGVKGERTGQTDGKSKSSQIWKLLVENFVNPKGFLGVSVKCKISHFKSECFSWRTWWKLEMLSPPSPPPQHTHRELYFMRSIHGRPYTIRVAFLFVMFCPVVQGPRFPPDMFKLVHYEECTVIKRVVGILLECFLVSVKC